MYSGSRNKTNKECKLLVGDVVVVKEDKISPRSSWRTGRVDSLIVGKDGYVRGAELRTISKEGKRTLITRPLQKIIPLEVSRDDTSCTDIDLISPSKVNPTDVDPTTPIVRPIPTGNVSVVSKPSASNSSSIPTEDVGDDSSASSRPKRDAAMKGERLRRLQCQQ